MELNIKYRVCLVVIVAFINTVCAEKSPSSELKPNMTIFNSTVSHREEAKIENVTSEYYLISTTKEPFEICELNSTCNGTDFLNATDSQLLVSNFTEKPPIIKNYPTGQQFCTCDLQLHICDINCCCDQDCSNSDKSIFQYCDEEPRFYDTRLCSYEKFMYINATPFTWQINQNGLFCVMKSNLPPYYILQTRQPILSYNASVSYRMGKFSWPKKEIDKEESEMTFKYGHNLWSIQKGIVKKFRIPSSFLSQRCLLDEDIYALKNVNTQCSQTDINDHNEKLKLKTYFQNIWILNITASSNQTKIKNGTFKCSKSSCLSITPFICNESFDKCVNISQNDVRLNTKCFLNASGQIRTCWNILKKLQYNFLHNGSRGLVKVNALLVPYNYSYSFTTSNKNVEFVQEFSVKFLWSTEKKNYSQILSGNPGYIVGKPILAGTLHNIGNKSHVILKIQRKSQDFKGSYLTIPENKNGECTSNNETYLTVEFGYNLLLKCKFHNIYEFEKQLKLTKEVINVKNNSKSVKTVVKGNITTPLYNGTVLCKHFQHILLDLWNFDDKQRIGMFGNANENKIEDWVPVLSQDKKEVLINKTVGYLFSQKNTLICSNLIRSLKISIFYAKVDIQTLYNQNKVLGVSYEFETASNSSLIVKNNSVFMNTDLETQVVFYDISIPKKKKIVDPPTLNIKLPYDFFYPFVKVDNSATSPMKMYYGCFCAVLIFVSNIVIKLF